MKINNILFAELSSKEEKEIRERKYIRMCLKNMICPVCNEKLIRLQTSDFIICEHCRYSNT